MNNPLEIELHIAVATVLRDYLAPGWRFTHPASGEHRDKRTAAKLKAMGTMPGWPDLILISPEGRFHGLELKRVKRKSGANQTDLTLEQLEFRRHCITYGWPYAITDKLQGPDGALMVFHHWGCLRVEVR